jgi:hypothetical protein
VSMDWQQMVALGIVCATAVFLARPLFSRRKFRFQRDLPCGCAGGGRPQESSIVFRARKGAGREVIVKMK